MLRLLSLSHLFLQEEEYERMAWPSLVEASSSHRNLHMEVTQSCGMYMQNVCADWCCVLICARLSHGLARDRLEIKKNAGCQ